MRAPQSRGRAGVTALTVALCLVLPISACSGEDAGSGPAADHVRAVVLPYLANAVFHIAAEEGYFAEQNLEVEFIRLPRTGDVIAALAQGEVDVATGMLTVSVLNAVAAGAPIRLVATMAHLSPDACSYNAFVARRDLVESGALQDPERIRGLRVDADVLMPHGYWLDELLAPFGLTADDLDVGNLSSPASVGALINGSIDVTIASEPFISQLTASGEAVIWRATGDIVPDFPHSILMYSAALLDEGPEVGERFATAVLAAARRFRLGKTPRNLALVESFTGLSLEQVSAACWPSGPDDGRVDASILRPYQEWAVSRGLTERVLSEDELIDHRFIDSANARLAR